jgi:predicted phosphodiesterase
MIMLLGDTHGNTKFVTNVAIPAAKAKNATWIYQVGDFGYWEHQQAGIQYLTDVNTALVGSNINLIFIQGNHDKISLLRQNYLNEDGFYKVRSNIWFAENGTVWSPDAGKTNFMALGGAYSVDKQWRLKNEAAAIASYDKAVRAMYADVHRESLWFPEEEITDGELDVILSKVSERVDVLLTHDKPISATVPLDLRPIAA